MSPAKQSHCKLVLLVALLCAARGAIAAEPAREPVVEMGIDAGHPGARIHREVFGQFAEHLGGGIYGGIWVGRNSSIPNVRGIRSDVVAALRALKVPDVRWPGGCFADEYHWRDGVGPAGQRRATVNTNWGDVPESNAFGSDEFMDFLQQIGSQPYLSVNVGSGSVREAADWLAYLTAPTTTAAGRERAANGHPAPYRVPYLGLGNESWGCGGALSPDFYVNEMRRFSRFVHNYNPAQRGPQAMQRIAVGADGASTDYLQSVMQAWHDKVWSWDIEGVSLHYYSSAGWPPAHPSQHFGEDEYALLLADTLRMERLIRTQTALMDRYDPQRKVALVVDEWGTWLAPLPGSNPGFLMQQNSLRDALLAALNLNIFARHAERVRMANIAQMINVLQAMVLTDGPRLVLTPTYHVFRMYVPFQDASLLPVSLQPGRYVKGALRLPQVDGIAAREADGRIAVALVNLDPARAIAVRIHLDHGRIGAVRAEQLTAPQVDAVNTFSDPTAVVPRALAASAADAALRVVLAPKSVSVLQFESLEHGGKR